MMGYKARAFGSLGNLTLDDLVPQDNFYRYVERTLDLSFVRELVRDRYAAGGRPSIDPVVFFKLQLVLFFEGMRSERQLERVGSDRLSVRWYLGYDLHEPLPDHSSLTRLRGLEKVNCEAVGTATGQNLKRLLAARGWGRRHFPGGFPGVHLSPPPRVLCA